jgi:hypothetical protein
MCDNDLIMCDVPRTSIEAAISAWDDFKRDPSDSQKFRSFDWLINVAYAKWQSYSDTRRASSA